MPTCLFAHPGAELFGSDRMLIESICAARDHGFDCVVALPEQGPLVGALRELGATVVIAPSLVLRKSLLRPRNWLRLYRDTFRGLGATWRLISRVRPDCVYVNTITIPLWPLVARLRRVAVLSHVHEAEASASALVNRVLYAPHLAAQRVIVNSRFSLHTIERVLPRLARRAHIVYNGVFSPEAPPAPRDQIDSPLRVLYIGRLSPRKGPDVVIEAARLLRDSGTRVRVGFLGSVFPGYEWFEDRLRAAADEAGLTSEVEFHGFHDEIWPFLAEADVLVVPSRADEPFGNTAVEGILAQRPVIASDTSGLREAAGGYATARLVPSDDAGALASALSEVLADWQGIRAKVSASADRALQRHAPMVYRESIGTHLATLTPHLH